MALTYCIGTVGSSDEVTQHPVPDRQIPIQVPIPYAP